MKGTESEAAGPLRCCVEARAELGEGPVWDDERQRLYWIDILGEQLHHYDPEQRESASFCVGQPVGAVALRVGGGLVLAVRDGFATFDPEAQSLTFLAQPEADRLQNRFNDGACDSAGRFWAGTMAFSADAGAGSLYRLSPGGPCDRVLEGLTIPNGLAWTADGATLYHVDSGPATVTAYDYDLQTGTISHGRVVIAVDEALGTPDGMTIDTEGTLWIAHYGGGCVRRWDPEQGTVLQEVDVPASRVTACTFGGADLKTLYITTATEGMSKEERRREPQAGSLFAVRPGAGGSPPYRFAG